jgi:hypothetical protein
LADERIRRSITGMRSSRTLAIIRAQSSRVLITMAAVLAGALLASLLTGQGMVAAVEFAVIFGIAYLAAGPLCKALGITRRR